MSKPEIKLLLGIRAVDGPVTGSFEDDEHTVEVSEARYELCLVVDVEHPAVTVDSSWRTRTVAVLLTVESMTGACVEAENWCDLNGYAGRLPWRGDVDEHGEHWTVTDLKVVTPAQDDRGWIDRCLRRPRRIAFA